MKVRKFEVDFSSLTPHWSGNREFAQMFNAASLCPSQIEPYLCKVLLKAKKLLPVKHAALQGEIDWFVEQETEHCKTHVMFNRMVSQGYAGIKEMERQYFADYNKLLKTKSLQFNLAYSEGFEALSALPTAAYFLEFDEFWSVSDPKVVAMWKWHLAEEFEHRNVVYDVYDALYGAGPVAYLRRIYGLFYSARHITKYSNAFAAILLAKDREGMNAEQLAASKARQEHVKKAMSRDTWRHLLRIASPRYSPHDRQPPPGLTAFLDNDNPGQMLQAS
jgi:predicted metal-dependent hydrolase